ncbi:hypothetical protein KOR42_04170 [Thalassoglobus neptunius]|uniref:Uncharacterized protein n=1 Tax=Thalassoglobus neptunius TaxID=1938619 RepID=A0A5C5X362_9PLAN|nr:hypothetical protein KOR42_04170 [Thalassoglobus neptunius]
MDVCFLIKCSTNRVDCSRHQYDSQKRRKTQSLQSVEPASFINSLRTILRPTVLDEILSLNNLGRCGDSLKVMNANSALVIGMFPHTLTLQTLVTDTARKLAFPLPKSMSQGHGAHPHCLCVGFPRQSPPPSQVSDSSLWSSGHAQPSLLKRTLSSRLRILQPDFWLTSDARIEHRSVASRIRRYFND